MPDMYQEVDNIFPQFANNDSCDIVFFSEEIQDLEEGCIVEFGVASAQTTIEMARCNPDRPLFVFDHFLGLEQTSKPTPEHVDGVKVRSVLVIQIILGSPILLRVFSRNWNDIRMSIYS